MGGNKTEAVKICLKICSCELKWSRIVKVREGPTCKGCGRYNFHISL